MKVSLLGLVSLIFVVGCSSPPPTIEVAPTPNIEATVEARLAEERASVNVSKDVNTPEPAPTSDWIPDWATGGTSQDTGQQNPISTPAP